MKTMILAVAALAAGFGTLACAGEFKTPEVQVNNPGIRAAAPEVKINTTEVNGRLVDDFSNLSFVNDPEVLGEWVSVDFVNKPDQFVPGVRKFRDSLYLEGLTFLPDGKTPQPWFGWTKGVVMHLGGDHTAARYTIKEIDGAKYMFFEWKSGDYIIRHQKPEYYVLKKK